MEDKDGITRRQFMTGQWFNKAPEDGVDSESPEVVESSQNVGPPERGLNLSRLARIAAIVVAVVLVMSVAISGVAAAQTGDVSVTANEAIQAQERALKLLDDLKAIGSESGVDVSSTVLGSIRDDLAQGNASYRAGAYADALEYYTSASEQAQSALTRAYTAHTEYVLNTSASYTQSLRADGYQTVNLAAFAERIDRLEARLAGADTLGEAKAVHADALSLRKDVADLDNPLVVDVAAFLTSPWGLVAVGMSGVIILLVGFGLGRRYSPSDTDNPKDVI